MFVSITHIMPAMVAPNPFSRLCMWNKFCSSSEFCKSLSSDWNWILQGDGEACCCKPVVPACELLMWSLWMLVAGFLFSCMGMLVNLGAACFSSHWSGALPFTIRFTIAPARLCLKFVHVEFAEEWIGFSDSLQTELILHHAGSVVSGNLVE